MKIKIQPMQSGEEDKVIRLVRDTFDRQVAPGYTAEGRENFYRYADVTALLARESTHTILVEKGNGEMIGILEMRGNDHVSLLFVNPAWQHQGVATALFEEAMKISLAHNPDLETISVHSTPNAVPFYQSLGFETVKPEQEKDGIRFTTMSLDLWR
jgi:GNAT superfamily N-acetyltransferase